MSSERQEVINIDEAKIKEFMKENGTPSYFYINRENYGFFCMEMGAWFDPVTKYEITTYRAGTMFGREVFWDSGLAMNKIALRYTTEL